MKTKFKLNFFVKIYSDMNRFVSFAINICASCIILKILISLNWDRTFTVVITIGQLSLYDSIFDSTLIKMILKQYQKQILTTRMVIIILKFLNIWAFRKLKKRLQKLYRTNAVFFTDNHVKLKYFHIFGHI